MRISCEEDEESFQRFWNNKQLSLRERYRHSKEGWFTRSHSAIKTQMNPESLHSSLRMSMKNVLEVVGSVIPETKLLTLRNVGCHRISAGLTHIDKILLGRLRIDDLSKLNTKNSPGIAKLIAKQQQKVMECLRCEIETSTNYMKDISLLLRVCKHLLQQRNFHSLLTVLLVISEFEDTIKTKMSCDCLYFNRLMSIYDPSGAYRNYRSYVGESKEDAIVTFPVFSRDIFLFFEHNEIWIDEKINEVFLHGMYDQYSTAKRASQLKIIGKVDPEILDKLLFVEL